MTPEILKLVEEEKEKILKADLYVYDPNLGMKVNRFVLNGHLDSFAGKIAKAVSDHIDLDNQCMKAYRLGEKTATDARDEELTEGIEGMKKAKTECRYAINDSFCSACMNEIHNSALSEVQKLIARKE